MAEDRIKDLYQRYGHLIHHRCIKILHSEEDAWDAVQTIFMKLIHHIDTIKEPSGVVAWLYTTATNHCFNVLRNGKKYLHQYDPDEISKDHHLEERISQRQIINLLVATQNQQIREAVYYTYIELLDQEEIRTLTGQSPATIRRNLSRFKDHCQRIKIKVGL